MRKTFQHLLDEVEVARLSISQQDPESVDNAGHKPAYYSGKLDEVAESLGAAIEGYDKAYAKDAQAAADEDPTVRNARLLYEQQSSANHVSTGPEPDPEPEPTPTPAPSKSHSTASSDRK